MRKRVRRRLRVRRDGVDAVADINADIAVNISRSRSSIEHRRSGEAPDRGSDERAGRPRPENEGGER